MERAGAGWARQVTRPEPPPPPTAHPTRPRTGWRPRRPRPRSTRRWQSERPADRRSEGVGCGSVGGERRLPTRGRPAVPHPASIEAQRRTSNSLANPSSIAAPRAHPPAAALHCTTPQPPPPPPTHPSATRAHPSLRQTPTPARQSTPRIGWCPPRPPDCTLRVSTARPPQWRPPRARTASCGPYWASLWYRRPPRAAPCTCRIWPRRGGGGGVGWAVADRPGPALRRPGPAPTQH